MKEKLLHERALVTCIAMLFICIILKLFGVQWFDLNTDIPILQEIDNVVMNSEILSFIYSFVFTFISSYMIILIVLKRNSKINILLTSLMVVVSLITKRYYNFYYFPIFIEILFLFIIILFNDKTKLKEILLCILLNLIYQIISLSLRGLNIGVSNYSLLVNVLMNVDYYLLLFLTYLYLKKGDFTLCGIVVVSFSSLANLLWKKRSENYSNKEGN